MKQYEIETWCFKHKGVEGELKPEWNAYLYKVGGKMFALVGADQTGRNIISLKLEPSYGEALRTEYADIVAGYYLNKMHWNSVYLDGSVSESLLQELIAQSYQNVLHSLTKKAQQEILSN